MSPGINPGSYTRALTAFIRHFARLANLDMAAQTTNRARPASAHARFLI
ncbi:MAG: hypothetical protein R3E96_11435 [Planctomycetota bacterium]